MSGDGTGSREPARRAILPRIASWASAALAILLSCYVLAFFALYVWCGRQQPWPNGYLFAKRSGAWVVEVAPVVRMAPFEPLNGALSAVFRPLWYAALRHDAAAAPAEARDEVIRRLGECHVDRGAGTMCIIAGSIYIQRAHGVWGLGPPERWDFADGQPAVRYPLP